MIVNNNAANCGNGKEARHMANTNTDTNLNIRINKELKSQADSLFSELGLSLSAAVNVFIRQAIRQGKIPFEISLNAPNAETIAAIEEAEKISNDPNVKGYTDFDELKRELDS